MIYPILKLVHIMSATILFGGGIFAALLGTIVFGSKKVKVIAEVGPHIVKVEFYLTILSALAQIITGLWMASIAGFPVLTGWLGWASILFVSPVFAGSLVFGCSIAWLIFPGRLSRQTQNYPLNIMRYLKIGLFLGLPSTAAMIGIFYLMVFKSV